MASKLRPISPGEILSMEFLKPLGISQSRLARDLNVPVGRINEIVQGRRAITPDTAFKARRLFQYDPGVLGESSESLRARTRQTKSAAKIERSVRPAEKKAA